MTDSGSSTKLQLPTFDGEEASYQVWWMRFMAYVTYYKFAHALTEGGKKDLPGSKDEELNEAKTDGKQKAAAKVWNAMAMACFMMAFTKDGVMQIVYKARVSTWPNGLAHLVVLALQKKYQPQDTIMCMELRQKLNCCLLYTSDAADE